MTTATFTCFLDYTSDAGFRVIGSNLNTALAAAGLVQTADTGQINWVSVTRPGGSNTAAGYEIWKLPDSSLYFKLEYGSGSNAANQFQAWVTVGQGSNGSGTLTGQLSSRGTWGAGVVTQSTVTNYTSYVSVTNGHLFIAIGPIATAANLNLATLIVGKTVDATGATTTLGFGVFRTVSGSGTAFQSVRMSAPAATYAESFFFSVVPGNVASSLTSTGANQAYEVWMNVPQVLPFLFGLVYVNAEIAKLGTFSSAQVGATAHTYLAIGSGAGVTAGPTNGGSTAFGIAGLYE